LCVPPAEAPPPELIEPELAWEAAPPLLTVEEVKDEPDVEPARPMPELLKPEPLETEPGRVAKDCVEFVQWPPCMPECASWKVCECGLKVRLALGALLSAMLLPGAVPLTVLC